MCPWPSHDVSGERAPFCFPPSPALASPWKPTLPSSGGDLRSPRSSRTLGTPELGTGCDVPVASSPSVPPRHAHAHAHMFTLTQTHMLTHAHTPRHTRSHTCSHAHTQRHARTPCSSHTDTHFHTHMFILIHMHTHSHAHLLTCTHVNSCLRHCRDTRVHTPVQPCSHCTHRHARSHSDTRTYKHAHSHTQITSDKKHLRQLCAPSLSLGFLKLNQNRQIIFIFILEFTF